MENTNNTDQVNKTGTDQDALSRAADIFFGTSNLETRGNESADSVASMQPEGEVLPDGNAKDLKEESKDTEKPNKDTKLAKSFAVLAKKEKAMVLREKELKDRETTLASKEKELTEKSLSQETLRRELEKDPVSFFKKLGVEDIHALGKSLIYENMGDDAPSDYLESKKEKQLRLELEELKARLSDTETRTAKELEQARKEAETKIADSTIQGFAETVTDFLGGLPEDKYENLQLAIAIDGPDQVRDDLVSHIVTQLQTDPDADIDLEKLVEVIDSGLSEHDQIKRLKQKVKKTPTTATQVNRAVSKSLSNEATATQSNPRELSEKERIALAAKQFYGEE